MCLLFCVFVGIKGIDNDDDVMFLFLVLGWGFCLVFSIYIFWIGYKFEYVNLSWFVIYDYSFFFVMYCCYSDD